MYKSLNDAKAIDPIFAEGTRVKVWYVKPELRRSFCMGARAAAKFDGNFIDTNDMTKTHILIGSIEAAGLTGEMGADEVAGKMQGDYWSPNGEAREMIRSLNQNTSFSGGDVIQIDDKFYTSDRWTMSEFNNDTFKKAE